MQRHAVLIDKNNGSEWTPLLHMPDRCALWITTRLYEFAAMGFEYGYSVERPDAPVPGRHSSRLANGAQSIMDEFISSLSRSGASAAPSSCCCRTAMKAKAQTTARHASSAICRCAQIT